MIDQIIYIKINPLEAQQRYGLNYKNVKEIKEPDHPVTFQEFTEKIKMFQEKPFQKITFSRSLQEF